MHNATRCGLSAVSLLVTEGVSPAYLSQEREAKKGKARVASVSHFYKTLSLVRCPKPQIVTGASAQKHSSFNLYNSKEGLIHK